LADDEHKLLAARDRAARAKALLDNPLLIEMFDSLEAAYVAAWKNSPPGADADRERAWMAVRILGEVRASLEKIVTFDGRFAEHALNALHPNRMR
jgi:hypothetical protein